MKSKSAGKVRLTSFDDLFGTGEAAAGETVTSVPLSQLHTFKDHPFRVLDDEKMQETVESVKRYGVLMPGIVRPHPKGGYEVIAGWILHFTARRRKVPGEDSDQKGGAYWAIVQSRRT